MICDSLLLKGALAVPPIWAPQRLPPPFHQLHSPQLHGGPGHWPCMGDRLSQSPGPSALPQAGSQTGRARGGVPASAEELSVESSELVSALHTFFFFLNR